MDDIEQSEFLKPIERLTRDLRRGAATLGDDEARFLVDSYYIIQENRKRTKNQESQLTKSGEPHDVISWLWQQDATLENQIKAALDIYTSKHLMGSWMRDVYGIGPVLSAGLLAHIDINKAPTAGHIWQYAGIAGDGQKPWEKGQKRPFNASLKTLCWKIGDSFVKFSNDEKCFYGKFYRDRKALEIERNEAGLYKQHADARLKRGGKEKVYHEQGKLSPGHLDLRARRYAVKLFLGHMQNEWYRRAFNKEPPLPYPIAHMGHAHVIKQD